MNKQIEALKLALEALNRGETKLRYEAIAAIKEALAEHPAQQQEPVAWMTPTGALYRTEDVDGCFDDKHIPLYTTPPQRKPLTDEEIEFIYADTGYNDIQMFARAIEAKLREKNA